MFVLLRGDSGLNSPRQLTDKARDPLNKVSRAIQTCQAQRINLNLPFLLTILGKGPQPYALIFQWDPEASDPLLILEWIFLPHQPGKTLTSKSEMMAQLIIR